MPFNSTMILGKKLLIFELFSFIPLENREIFPQHKIEKQLLRKITISKKQKRFRRQKSFRFGSITLICRVVIRKIFFRCVS